MPNYTKGGGAPNRSRTTYRVPCITSEHIISFTGGNISNTAGLLKNVIVDSYAGEKDRLYITQRPSVSLFDDASDDTVNTDGRGIYHWAANDVRYFVNNNIMYRDSYSAPMTVTAEGALVGTAMSAGTEKVYFLEWSSDLNDYLFIIDPQASDVFIIQKTQQVDIGDNDPINVQDLIDNVGLTGTGAPFHASEDWDFTGLEDIIDLGFAHGAEILDKYMVLGAKNGRIYTSNVDNFLSWSALDFTTAERENDQLLAIAKTGDHILAMGERTTELFYDAENPSGSPFAPRKDLFYQKGIANGDSVWVDGNDVYFLAIKPTGDFALNVLKDYKLDEISSSTINSYLRHGRTEATLSTKLSGFSSGAHTYVVLTVFNASNNPIVSLVYDGFSGMWGEWETTLVGLEDFALVGWSTRTPETPVTTEGILSNGDLFFIADDFDPQDTTNTTAYFAGQYSAGSYSLTGDAAAETSSVVMQILLDNIEFNSSDRKFMHKLQAVCNMTSSSQTLTIEWSDDEGTTWYSGTLDTSYHGQINRLGQFVRRRFRVTYAGSEQLRLEALDTTCTHGGN